MTKDPRIEAAARALSKMGFVLRDPAIDAAYYVAMLDAVRAAEERQAFLNGPCPICHGIEGCDHSVDERLAEREYPVPPSKDAPLDHPKPEERRKALEDIILIPSDYGFWMMKGEKERRKAQRRGPNRGFAYREGWGEREMPPRLAPDRRQSTPTATAKEVMPHSVDQRPPHNTTPPPAERSVGGEREARAELARRAVYPETLLDWGDIGDLRKSRWLRVVDALDASRADAVNARIAELEKERDTAWAQCEDQASGYNRELDVLRAELAEAKADLLKEAANLEHWRHEVGKLHSERNRLKAELVEARAETGRVRAGARADAEDHIERGREIERLKAESAEARAFDDSAIKSMGKRLEQMAAERDKALEGLTALTAELRAAGPQHNRDAALGADIREWVSAKPADGSERFEIWVHSNGRFFYVLPWCETAVKAALVAAP